jgi:DNA repair protein SbcD/Mre11
MLKILHTADWHLGQMFQRYDRFKEHEFFLNWLLKTLESEEIDVLLISGDIFDISNPAASTIRQFYTFLNKAARLIPTLQIVVIAGNHDSPARIETPKPLLESSNIHLVGYVEKTPEKEIDCDKLIIPLKDKYGEVMAFCLAIPFLRIGDYPSMESNVSAYIDGVAALYELVTNEALKRKSENQGVIAMGHLHVQHVEITDMDKMERQIMGGVEGIPVSAFSNKLAYVALGHIHKAQLVGGRQNVRYSGSPLPMSFSERNYKHQVIAFNLEGNTLSDLRLIEIPLCVHVISVPVAHAPIEKVLQALEALPEVTGDKDLAPYLEVRVLEDRPDPSRRYKIEKALEGKYVRLATINLKSAVEGTTEKNGLESYQKLDDLKPLDIFSKVYETKYGNPAPDDMLQLFNQIAFEVAQSEEA